MPVSPRSITIATFAFSLWAQAELPPPKVLDRYRQMLLANPVEGTALDRLWKAYADKGRTSELVEQFRSTETFAGKMVLGHLLRRSGDPEGAISAYELAAGLDSTSPLPHRASARILKEQRKADAAIKALEKSFELLTDGSPQRAEVLLEKGSIWADAGNQEKAAEAWEHTVTLSPADLGLRRKLVDTYLRTGLGEQALPHLQHIIENAAPAERAAGYRELASVQQRLGNTEAAIAALESGVALTQPGNWLRDELLRQLIRLHEREQRVPELEARWIHHVEENPRDLGGYLQLLTLFERTGDLEKQRTWLEKLTALAPQTPEYKAHLARLLVRLDDLPAATKLIDQILGEQPGHVDLSFERARLDVLQGATDAAQRRVAQLVQRTRGDESIRVRAMAFYRQHRLWAAIEEQLSTDAASGSTDALVTFAEFLFAQNRAVDAEKELSRLVAGARDSQQRAAAWERIARVRKTHGRIDAAADAAMEALAILPRDAIERRGLLHFHAELRSTLNQLELARAAYEEAFQLSQTPSERTESDQRLFEVVRQQRVPEPESSAQNGLLTLPGADLGTEDQPSALKKYLNKLTHDAEAASSPDAWLRVARWHSWRRDHRAALDAANKALAIEPGFIAAHEFIIQLTAGDPNSPTPGWHLAKLIEIDPSGSRRHRRQAAQLDLQAGRVEKAINTLEGLAHDQPGDLDTLIDLATAQQRAGQLREALATWQRVHAAGSATRRTEVLDALVQLHKQQKNPTDAAELLLKEIETRKDAREKQDRFTELLKFCKDNALLHWLRGRWEERRKRSSEDYFEEQSLGRILKEQGERNAAFEVLSRALSYAPDPAAALPELVREAEDLYRLEDAIALQARIVRISATEQPDEWIRLAQLQERHCDFPAAAATWKRIVGRYPRDAATLSEAAEFFLRDGRDEEARRILRQVRAVEPTNTAAALQLATVELQLGNPAKAREPLETILVLTPAEQPGETIEFPAIRSEDGNRLQSEYLAAVRNRGGQPKAEVMQDLRGFWSERSTSTRNDRTLRLKAIQKLAEIIRDHGGGTERKGWIDRWNRAAASTPGEAISALYYAAAWPEVLDLVSTLMQREPASVQYKQAFIWFALQTGQVDRLAEWLESADRTATDRDFVVIALGQYLEDGAFVDLAMLERLFPPSSPSRLWQVAALLAARSRYDLAAALGGKAFEQGSVHRQTMGYELAHWYLCLGQPDRARTIFRETSELAGDSFEAYSYSALRALYLLSPEEERSGLLAAHATLKPGTAPVPREITAILLHGLSENTEDAKKHILRLVQMGVHASAPREDQPSVTSRPWTFLLSAGLHLQAWKMGDLAEYLWEQALADPTLVRLQGDHAQEVASEMRLKLIALKIARKPLHDLGSTSADLLRNIAEDSWMSVGESLEALGAFAHAVQFYRLLWDREPDNPQVVRNLLNACHRALDEETLKGVLREGVAKRIFPNEAIQRDFAMQLVDVLERRNDHAEAVQILKTEIARAPTDLRLHLRLVELEAGLGDDAEAEKTWRQILSIDPSHAAARRGLANLHAALGRYADAIATLRQGSEPSSMLPGLLFSTGSPEEALDVLKQVSSEDLPPALEGLWIECLRAGNRRIARLAAQIALHRTGDPATRFQFYAKLIESFDPDSEQAKIRRELRHLQRQVSDDASLASRYHTWLADKSEQLKAEQHAERELKRSWNAGRGALSAGTALLSLQLNRWHSGAPRTLAQLLRREDLRTPVLEGILAALETKLPRLAPAIHERLTRLNPLQDERILDWSRSLQRIGEETSALRVLEQWGARAWLNEEFAARVAALKASLHASGAAERLFHFTRANDIARSNYSASLVYADFRRRQGDLSGARSILSDAYGNPGCLDFRPLAQWLQDAGKLPDFDRECASFRLTPRQRVLAREALFTHYVDHGNDLEAFAVLESLPQVAVRPILERVERLAARTGDYPRAAAILERHLQQGTPPFPVFRETFARIELARANSMATSGNEAERTERLKRANELAPTFFPAAVELALHFRRAKQPQEANRVLDQLIAHTRNQDEREKAQRLRSER